MSSTTPPPDFSLFTSLRYDAQLLTSDENTKLSGNGQPSPLYNFVFHYERLINALDHFGWSTKSNSSTDSHPDVIKPVSSIEKLRETCNNAVDNYFLDNVELSPMSQALKVSVGQH